MAEMQQPEGGTSEEEKEAAHKRAFAAVQKKLAAGESGSVPSMIKKDLDKNESKYVIEARKALSKLKGKMPKK